MKKLTAILLAAVALTACRKQDPTTPDTTVYDIVTYESTDDDSSVSIFTYQRIDDSPLITLSANWIPPSKIEPGKRMLLAYQTDHPGESGPITIKMAMPTVGGDPVESATPSVGHIQVKPVSVWRSGPYLNLRAQLTIAGGAISAALEMDRNTVDSDFPAFYLNISQPSPATIETTVKDAYCSWDIGSTWNLPTCRGVKLFYRGSGGITGELTLTKQQE